MKMRAIRRTALVITFTAAVFLTSAATDARAQLLIKNDERPCKLSIDGEEVATMKANGVYRANVGMGEHLLEAVSLDGYYKTEQTIKVGNSQQQVIKLSLTPDYEKLIRAAYEGKFIVTLKEEKYLWSDTGCYELDFALGEVPRGTILRIIAPQRLLCTGKGNGGAKVEYKGHVGWMFELYLNFTMPSSEVGEALKAEARRQQAEQQAEADRQQATIRRWAGHWEAEGSVKEYVEDGPTYTTYKVSLTIDVDDNGGCEAVSILSSTFYFRGGPGDPPQILSTRHGKCTITDQRKLDISLGEFVDDVSYTSGGNAVVTYSGVGGHMTINLVKR
jgi:hypothetical protein